MGFSTPELEWVAIPFSRISSWPMDWIPVYCIACGFLTIWTTREAHRETYMELYQLKCRKPERVWGKLRWRNPRKKTNQEVKRFPGICTIAELLGRTLCRLSYWRSLIAELLNKWLEVGFLMNVLISLTKLLPWLKFSADKGQEMTWGKDYRKDYSRKDNERTKSRDNGKRPRKSILWQPQETWQYPYHFIPIGDLVLLDNTAELQT